MSKNYEIQNFEDANEGINWLEEAICKKHIKFYEYEHFDNIQEIGSGSFGKVFRANWKHFGDYLALKSFFNLDSATIKEIVRELILQRDVDFHSNIIRFHGITKFESEHKIDQTKNYLLVMEYADGGTLRNYLKKNFHKFTWDDKYNLAYQLAGAVSCLHSEGIVHRDLHSCNVLVHQDVIKLADFGLSRRIEEASKSQSKLLGMAPYVDPKRFMNSRNSKLDEKSDVYSIGVLLWEISSGTPPFNEETNEIGLIYDITQGRRETPVPGTPIDYVKLYTDCWNGEPNNRPCMNEVVKRLKLIISQRKDMTDHAPRIDLLRLELNKLIQNFNNNDEIECNFNENENETSNLGITDPYEKNLSIMINEMVDLIFKELNRGIDWKITKQHINDYPSKHNINLQEIYSWLLNNQNNSDAIFLLGYFNYSGIVIIRNLEEAFSLFENASGRNHILAQRYVGKCYEFGCGILQNETLAFEYFRDVADKGCAAGQLELGFCYEKGIGIEIDLTKAAEWYEKAANNGHLVAMYNLGNFYLNGTGVEKDYHKAFELFDKSAEGEHPDGMVALGYCYYYGTGVDCNKRKAAKLYQRAAYLGNDAAQYNLGIMYERGDGIERNIFQAINWYEHSAKQKHQGARDRLNVLKKL